MNELQTRQYQGLRHWQIILPLFAVWLLTVGTSLFVHRGDIPLLRFGDPDDAMRLLEVRDFLAGQSWFDVSQHRANPPLGGPMHWSRLVDLPIAAVIVTLRPFVGAHWAELGAILIVPALTLAALLSALYWAVRGLMGQPKALLCCAGFAISPFIFAQVGAMRIDHHAWQVVMMALALGGTLHAGLSRGGLVAGLAMAVWLQISIEGLPLAALTGGVMTMRYVIDAKEWPRLASYLWTLLIASVCLLMGTHGWQGSLVSYCDSFSPVYLAPLAVVPPLMTMLYMTLGRSSATRRFLSVALAVGLATAIFMTNGRQCLAGPFGALDPIVYEVWYKAIPEGRPLWEQDLDTAIIILLPVLIGLSGYLTAIYTEKNSARRLDWVSMLCFAVGSTILAILVMRTGFVAHLLSIPGAAWLTAVLFRRARALDAAALRIPATIMSVMLLFPIVVMPVKSAALPKQQSKNLQNAMSAHPVGVNEIAALDQLAPTVLFAPIDISPGILLRTRNGIIGTAHHRNAQGMKLVIGAFVAQPQDARAIVSGSSATYLLIAPTGETDRYRKFAPQGLAAKLLDGKTPDWLTPVSLPGLKFLRLYRIERPRSGSGLTGKTPDAVEGRPSL